MIAIGAPVRRLVLAALCLTTVGAAWGDPPPDLIDECDVAPGPDRPDWCLDQGQPGTPGDPDPVGLPQQPNRPDDAPPCGWVTVPTGVVPLHSTRPVHLTNGRPPEGVEVIWQGWCYDAPDFPAADFRGPFRWLPVGDPVLVTPADVAAGIYESMQGRMPDPAVVSSPPAGADAVVGVPVFVTVTNWQPEIVERGTLLGDTVTVTATAQLMLNSGESGAAASTCAGPGSRYDPALGDIWVQAAAPGACTLTYERRTGVSGRPEQWASTVTVRWSITWSASSGESDVFPAVDRTVPLPRSVDEVQAIVIGGED